MTFRTKRTVLCNSACIEISHAFVSALICTAVFDLQAQGAGQLWDGIIYYDTDISIDLHEEHEHTVASVVVPGWSWAWLDTACMLPCHTPSSWPQKILAHLKMCIYKHGERERESDDFQNMVYVESHDIKCDSRTLSDVKKYTVENITFFFLLYIPLTLKPSDVSLSMPPCKVVPVLDL